MSRLSPSLVQQPVASAGGDFSASNSSSSAYADLTGVTVTTPNVTGKTYTVKFHMPNIGIGNGATFAVVRMEFDGADADQTMVVGHETTTTVTEYYAVGTIARGGIGPNVAVSIEWLSNQNTKTVYWSGSWAAEVIEEA